MGKYKKRADGRYATQICIGYQENGKRKVKTLYGKTIAELDRKVVEFKSLMNQGFIVDTSGYTLASWSQNWLDTYGTKGLKESTIRGKVCLVEKHIINSPFGQLPINKIKTYHLQELINATFDTAPSLTSCIKSHLVNIFETAVKNNIIIKNIAKDIEVPKYSQTPKRALTKEEQFAFRTADLTPKEHLFVGLGLDCGLRRGEILALTLNDFNFKDGTVNICKSYDPYHQHTSNSPKTSSGFRTVPVPDHLLELARNIVKNTGELQLFLHKGKPIALKTFDYNWKKLVDKVISGMDSEIIIDNIRTSNVTPHILRHTYATNLFYAGIDVKAAQYLMGHSDIQTTLKIYTHLNLDNEEVKTKLYQYINNMSISQKSVK